MLYLQRTWCNVVGDRHVDCCMAHIKISLWDVIRKGTPCGWYMQSGTLLLVLPAFQHAEHSWLWHAYYYACCQVHEKAQQCWDQPVHACPPPPPPPGFHDVVFMHTAFKYMSGLFGSVLSCSDAFRPVRSCGMCHQGQYIRMHSWFHERPPPPPPLFCGLNLVFSSWEKYKRLSFFLFEAASWRQLNLAPRRLFNCSLMVTKPAVAAR